MKASNNKNITYISLVVPLRNWTNFLFISVVHVVSPNVQIQLIAVILLSLSKCLSFFFSSKPTCETNVLVVSKTYF